MRRLYNENTKMRLRLAQKKKSEQTAETPFLLKPLVWRTWLGGLEGSSTRLGSSFWKETSQFMNNFTHPFFSIDS